MPSAEPMSLLFLLKQQKELEHRGLYDEQQTN
jgi:hypothetical protein